MQKETSPDEYNQVSHLSFLTLAEKFGVQSGDEQFHDEKGNFKIPKVEVITSDEVGDGIESVDDKTTSEEEAEDVETKEPAEETRVKSAEVPSHESAPREETLMETTQPQPVTEESDLRDMLNIPALTGTD